MKRSLNHLQPRSALELLEGYAARRLSPVEVVETSLAAIAADASLNAWVHVASATARAEARASEARWGAGQPLGRLDGIPVGVKDLIAVAGQKMRRGSPAYPEDFMPGEDAPAVARLREAGAILIGKTATPDAGCKLDTTSLVHGTTGNPHNPACTAGGSSGGSAAALAAGHVPIALGTDGGGSIRVPAAFCGVYGLKPSTGRIPAPPGPFWPHAVTGPMTGMVIDTALAWEAVTRPDARDPYAWPYQETGWVAQTRRGVAGLRVALAPAFRGIGAAPEITGALTRAADALADAGATVTNAEPDWPCDPLEPFLVFWRCMYAASLGMMPPEQQALTDPAVKAIAAAAAMVTRAQLQQAMIERDRLAVVMSLFHQRFDLLLCPVVPCQPWAGGRATPPPLSEDDWAWCPFAYPFNLTRQPAASVPFGVDAHAMPLAVQLAAAAGRDDLVLRASLVLETANLPARTSGDR